MKTWELLLDYRDLKEGDKNKMDINYSPEQHDSISPEITYLWWCEKCLDYHHEPFYPYGCPYDDIEYCPHCGQIIRRQ